jgi:hypothetical protein
MDCKKEFRKDLRTFNQDIPMKKALKAFLAALLFSNFITAKTIQVTSPGNDKDIQPAIQTAVNGAVNGDIIVLPAGQFVVNKSVVITKFISIKGQGLGITTLYRSESTPDATLSNDGSWRGIFRFTINSTVSSGIVISDMTLKSKKPSLINGDGLSVASDIGIEMVKCIDFVITRCRFENFGNGAVSVLHEDNLASGLIYKCEFVHNCKGYDALGLGYGVVVYGVNSQWIADPKFGSGNFIFVEDNMFDYHRHSIAGGGCALYVFRYNTVKNNIAGNTAHAIDAHEARLEAGGNYYSSRAIEVYNNSIVNTIFRDGTTNCPNGTPIVAGKSPGWLVECAIRTRGGEAVIHDNYIEGYRFGVGLVTPKLSAYPSPYQQGYLSASKYGATHTGVDGDKANGDVFVWSDTYKSYAPGNSQCVYFYNYTPDYIVAERDYHLFAKAGYTPYTYPHPLRNTTTPASPIALTTSTNNVTCNGSNNGSATVTATGGTGSYTYNWSSSPVQTTATASNLLAGTYTVTVKDAASTTKTAIVTISEPAAMTVTTTVTSDNCGKKDGTSTAVVSGGTAPYTYSWTTLPVQTTVTATGLTTGGYTVTATDKNGCTASVKSVVPLVAAPTVTTTVTADNCGKKDGTSTAVVSGGTAPYTYSWTTLPVQTAITATGLTTGGYTVTVTDKNGCASSIKSTVPLISGPAVSTTMTTENCNKKDATATAVVSGGTAPYTYSWNTLPAQTTATSTGLTAGGYTVSVTDKNGCSTLTPVVVTQTAPLGVTTALTPENCRRKDGTATVTVSGGNSPYTYTWTTIPIQTAATATGLTAGGYTVTVTDKSGCSINVPVVIKRSYTSLKATITSKDVSCNTDKSGSATVNIADGVAPYTYEWNTVPAQNSQLATNLEVGEYEVIVTDAVGCQTKTAAKIAKAQPMFNLSTVKTDASCETCKDGTASVIVSGQPSTYTYTWSAPWNMTLSTTNSATGLAVGNYSITVTDNNGCAKQSTAVISSTIATGIISAERSAGEDITLFPNPTQSKFNISNGDFKPAESVLVVLYNTAGVEVYSKILVKEGEVIAVDTENRLEPGIYVVVASSQDHMYKKKIIITQ